MGSITPKRVIQLSKEDSDRYFRAKRNPGLDEKDDEFFNKIQENLDSVYIVLTSDAFVVTYDQITSNRFIFKIVRQGYEYSAIGDFSDEKVVRLCK